MNVIECSVARIVELYQAGQKPDGRDSVADDLQEAFDALAYRVKCGFMAPDCLVLDSAMAIRAITSPSRRYTLARRVPDNAFGGLDLIRYREDGTRCTTFKLCPALLVR